MTVTLQQSATPIAWTGQFKMVSDAVKFLTYLQNKYRLISDFNTGKEATNQKLSPDHKMFLELCIRL